MIVRRSLATALAIGLWLVMAAVTLAQSPSATAAGGDPRSPGEGPGLVGDPVLAIGGVALVAAIAVGATLAYVRFTGGSRWDGDEH